jgi:hypothetical protein
MSAKLEKKDIIQSIIGIIGAALSLYVASEYSKLIAYLMALVLVIISIFVSFKTRKKALAGDAQAIKDLNKRIYSLPAILQWIIIIVIYAVAIYVV